MPRSTLSRWLCGLAVLAAIALVWPAHAGPPLICHPVDIGNAESLPWGSSAFDEDGRYSRKNVVRDTLDLLDEEAPVLVRMETLRRAAIYLKGDQRRSDELLEHLMMRVMDAEARDRPDALAWFDAGFLVQVYHQWHGRNARDRQCGVARGVAGYAWIQHAIELRADDPGLEFAAALMTVMADREAGHAKPLWAGHLDRARAGAAGNTLLTANVRKFGARIKDHGH